MKGLTFALFILGIQASISADWPMAGHDPLRSSAAIEDDMPDASKLVWSRRVTPYICSKVQIVTSGETDLVYVSTVDGVCALDPETGGDVWQYGTSLPVSHSPTYADGTLYFGCHDNTVHALDARTGVRKWQTARAGAGFDVNPLLVDGKVYAGCRDSYFYCFDADDGKCLWTFKAEGPITFSAAYAEGRVFFAGLDCRVYALDAASGRLLWKTEKLHGEGFYSWWPVLVAGRVLVPGSSNHRFEGGAKLVNQIIKENAWGAEPSIGELPGPIDGEGFVDAAKFVAFQERLPHTQTFFVLDQETGQQRELAPILYVGNPSGTRHPPAIGADGLVWTANVTAYDTDFPRQGFCGWKIGTSSLFLLDPGSTESADETRAHSIIGPHRLYWLHKNDQGGAIMSLTGGTRAQLDDYGRDYHLGYANFNYGDYPPDSRGWGTHGNQNPPVPLNGKVYFHRSNAVICFGAQGGADHAKSLADVSFTQPPADTMPEKLPNAIPPESLLAEQVRKMIDVGNLGPLDANCTEHYWSFRGGFGDMPNHYWQNPAETIYTLCRALPHVPDDLQADLRDYLRSEWRLYPSTEVQYMKWGGASRQYANIPEAGSESRLNMVSRFPGWQFNPFNYYACWQYAKAGLGSASDLLDALPKPKRFPDDEFGAALPLRGLPHVLNCYIAGYYGYLGLLEAAGRERDPELVAWLDEAQEKRVEYLKDDPRSLHAVEAGGFKYLIPELGTYIRENALPEAREFIDTYGEAVAPVWFIARADEVTRMTKNHLGKSTAYAEGSTSHYYEYWSLFQARALALGEPREVLETYLDAPGVERGDLFYIQNLCAVLEAE